MGALRDQGPPYLAHLRKHCAGIIMTLRAPAPLRVQVGVGARECQGRGPGTMCLSFSDVFLFQLLNRLPFNYSHKRGDNTKLPTAINKGKGGREAGTGAIRSQ